MACVFALIIALVAIELIIFLPVCHVCSVPCCCPDLFVEKCKLKMYVKCFFVCVSLTCASSCIVQPGYCPDMCTMLYCVSPMLPWLCTLTCATGCIVQPWCSPVCAALLQYSNNVALVSNTLNLLGNIIIQVKQNHEIDYKVMVEWSRSSISRMFLYQVNWAKP